MFFKVSKFSKISRFLPSVYVDFEFDIYTVATFHYFFASVRNQYLMRYPLFV